MKKLQPLLLLSIFIAAVVGCNSLPEGDPPKGLIVAPTAGTKEIMSYEEAKNYMTTEFGAAVIGVVPGNSTIFCNSRLGGMVVERNAGYIALRTAGPRDAEYVLCSTLQPGEKRILWTLTLKKRLSNETIFEKSVNFSN